MNLLYRSLNFIFLRFNKYFINFPEEKKERKIEKEKKKVMDQPSKNSNLLHAIL